ncbi:MAG: redoxin domain-containing protein, partial [Ignavibacteriaceae bacterium]
MSNRILSIGSAFPTFTKKAVVSLEQGKEFADITSEDHKKAEKWMVMFWYPKDFTFVCPTEIVEFDKHLEEFTKKETVLIGASTDSEFSHLGWRVSHSELKGLRIPLLADTSKSLA